MGPSPRVRDWPLFLVEMKRCTTGAAVRSWRSVFFALGDPHTSCMT
jgi:hypothetical protein